MRDVLESNYSIRVLRSAYLDVTLVIPIHREENNPIAKTPRHRWIVQWSMKIWKRRLSSQHTMRCRYVRCDDKTSPPAFPWNAKFIHLGESGTREVSKTDLTKGFSIPTYDTLVLSSSSLCLSSVPHAIHLCSSLLKKKKLWSIIWRRGKLKRMYTY